MNIKSTDYRVQITESGSVPGSVLAAIRKASVLCTLCSVLLISSCTHDEITPPVNTTNDALALLPGNTPVGIKAEITDNREQSTTTRAEGDESATTYYALDEIHADMNVTFIMYLPGASDENNLQRRGTSTLNTLADTEPFSTLMLKDFNLTEGNGRCVSRWTVLTASSGGIDNLWGWARLTADANGQPVLNYAMQRGNAKVTIVVQDENGQPVDVSGDKVTATVSLPKTTSEVIYTPEGETEGKHLNLYLQTEVKTLAADEDIDPNRIALGTSAIGTENFDFDGMLTTDVNGYYGENNNTLTAIVSATATHTTTNGTTFTPIAGGPQFTDADKLTIIVADDYSGLTSSQTGGTYSLKLSEVKLSDTEYLTALEPGKHYTLTVTLRHNTLVAATATIGAWSTASANANIGGDGAKIYSYDATTNTYTIFEEDGLEAALADRAKNDPDATSTVVLNGVTIVPSGTSLSGIPLKMEDGELWIDKVTDNIYYSELPAIIANGSLCVKVDGTCEEEEYGMDEDIRMMKSLIQSAIAKGVTGVYVTGMFLSKLQVDYGNQTVLGEAIEDFAIGTIDLIIPNVSSIPRQAFSEAPAIKSLTFGSVITNVGEGAFDNNYTPNCDLTLSKGHDWVEEGENKKWEGYTWKSITLK